MQQMKQKLSALNWQSLAGEMNERGFALVRNLLTTEQCNELIQHYGDTTAYRKTVVMERYRFGLGEYKYFAYPLPGLIRVIRESVYEKLVPLANDWMKLLDMGIQFPGSFRELQAFCHAHNQVKPTVLILKYGKGGYNTLHQDLYGDIFFPVQSVLFLNEPGKDYTGGEFVLTQQVPRAQSKAIVVQPKRGDMLIFPTSFRPVKGARGYYRANMKHGVSEVRDGDRHTVGIIFHDALT